MALAGLLDVARRESMLGSAFSFLGFWYIKVCFLSFLSCLVESYFSHLYYLGRVILMLSYLRCACVRRDLVLGLLRLSLGTVSARGFPVRFPFGRSCL